MSWDGKFTESQNMIEIHQKLFVGSQTDYERIVRREDGWRVVQACRDPYHRRALRYTGRAAPKGHPEYLIARRSDRLILNLLDADDPSYIPKEIMDAALAFIEESLGLGCRVLVHCNQGQSRGPSIGLLYLAAKTEAFSGLGFEAAHDRFREIYPGYDPHPGVRGFLMIHWTLYCRGHGPSRGVAGEAALPVDHDDRGD
jgi:hypothetical protein